MLAHAKSGHWYLSQAWGKAVAWVWNEHHCRGKLWTVCGACGEAFPDTDGYLRVSTQSQEDQVGPGEVTTGNKVAQGGLGGQLGCSPSQRQH